MADLPSSPAMRRGTSQNLIVELLLKNDNNYRWLSLTNNDIGLPISELTAALLQNHSLRKVSCHAGFLASLAVDDLLALLSALSQLPHLQDLWLALPVPSRQAQTTATTATPPVVCRSSEVLETLLLNNTDLAESDNMDDVSNNNSSDEEWISNTLNNKNSNSRLQLHKLTIRGMDDAGCRVLARALQQQPSASMTDLQLRGLTTTAARRMTAASSDEPSRVTRRGILEIAEMLHHNRSLERVEMAYQGLDGSCCQALAKALAVNDKLQKLDLASSRSKRPRRRNNNNNNNLGRTTQQEEDELLEQGLQELVETIRQQNDTLCHLNISQAEGDPKILLDLLTKLNRSGARAYLRGNGSRGDKKIGARLDHVVKILSRHNKETNNNASTSVGSISSSHPGNPTDPTHSRKEDISAVYELLSLNPALWDPVKANAKARKTSSTSTAADTGAENMCICNSSNTKVSQQEHQNPRVRPHSTGKRSPLSSLRAESDSPCPKKVKPVMARWNENLISILEREKVEQYKRRTLTIY